MESRQLMKDLAVHPLVRSQMAMQMQLGLPYLEKRNGELFLRFLPHKEELQGETLLYYAPQYELEFIYPFQKVTYFRNNLSGEVPLAQIDALWLAENGKLILDELYNALSRVLTFREEDGQVSELSVSKYQQAYWMCVKRLGLEALYGEGQA